MSKSGVFQFLEVPRRTPREDCDPVARVVLE